jgi:hypothetical protein
MTWRAGAQQPVRLFAGGHAARDVNRDSGKTAFPQALDLVLLQGQQRGDGHRGSPGLSARPGQALQVDHVDMPRTPEAVWRAAHGKAAE